MIPDLVSGFVFSMVEKNPAPFADETEFQKYYQSCYAPDPKVNETIDKAISDIQQAHDDHQAVMTACKSIIDIIPDIEAGFSPCS